MAARPRHMPGVMALRRWGRVSVTVAAPGAGWFRSSRRPARARSAGAGTAYEVACALRWTRRGRQLVDLDPFNQMLAVTETRIHLELLVAQGRLAASTDGDVTVYATASPLSRP